MWLGSTTAQTFFIFMWLELMLLLAVRSVRKRPDISMMWNMSKEDVNLQRVLLADATSQVATRKRTSSERDTVASSNASGKQPHKRRRQDQSQAPSRAEESPKVLYSDQSGPVTGARYSLIPSQSPVATSLEDNFFFEPVGLGFCKDQHKAMPWVEQHSCLSFNDCSQQCVKNCVGFAWSPNEECTEDRTSQSCREQKLPSCVHYLTALSSASHEAVSQSHSLKSGCEEFICYRLVTSRGSSNLAMTVNSSENGKEFECQKQIARYEKACLSTHSRSDWRLVCHAKVKTMWCKLNSDFESLPQITWSYNCKSFRRHVFGNSRITPYSSFIPASSFHLRAMRPHVVLWSGFKGRGRDPELTQFQDAVKGMSMDPNSYFSSLAEEANYLSACDSKSKPVLNLWFRASASYMQMRSDPGGHGLYAPHEEEFYIAIKKSPSDISRRPLQNTILFQFEIAALVQNIMRALHVRIFTHGGGAPCSVVFKTPVNAGTTYTFQGVKELQWWAQALGWGVSCCDCAEDRPLAECSYRATAQIQWSFPIEDEEALEFNKRLVKANPVARDVGTPHPW